MSVGARITIATLIAVALGVSLVATGIVGVPLFGLAMLVPGLLVAVLLGNSWSFSAHAVGTFVATFIAIAVTGFAMSAPALLIGIAWAMSLVLGLGVAVPFRLVRGARARLNPEPTTRAQRRRAAAR